MLADRADIADTSAKRRTGLLKHSGLAPGEGLWIVPCEGVHTFFMKFPIDVVFLNKKRTVLKIRPNMGRRRIALSSQRAFGAGAACGKVGGDRDASRRRARIREVLSCLLLLHGQVERLLYLRAPDTDVDLVVSIAAGTGMSN